jgi:hypothetical protein
VIQDALDAAVHAQSRSVETVRRPLPPSGGNEEGDAEASTAHRANSLGPTFVDADEPHAAARHSGKSTAMARAAARCRIGVTYASPGPTFPAERPARRKVFQKPCKPRLSRFRPLQAREI